MLSLLGNVMSLIYVHNLWSVNLKISLLKCILNFIQLFVIMLTSYTPSSFILVRIPESDGLNLSYAGMA
jgi:hypothetical protein